MPGDTHNAQLVDGSTPATPDDLFRRLAELEIDSDSFSHPPVHTVAEAKAKRGALQGAHIKNLFLRNKKGAMWLIICLEDRRIDLRSLASRLGAGRFSFGSARRLMQYLGVVPGAVTPVSVINDLDASVEVVLDRGLLQFEQLNCHPLTNTMTTALAIKDLIRFLGAEGHPPRVLDLD